MKKIGFIGCGNMGGAILGGILKSGLFKPEEVAASDAFETAANAVREQFSVDACTENRAVAENSEIVLLSVKPQFYAAVIAEIRDLIREDQVVVTIAPGWTLKRLEEAFGRPVKLVRCMPNTPALVGVGVTAYCQNTLVEKGELDRVVRVLESFGQAEPIPENLFDMEAALCGSSPAYVYMMIEAMADAAVHGGIARAQAYRMAAQALIGSARMVLETGRHPGDLKDMVCSPGGSTIEAVRVLEEKGLRSSLFEAMLACADKCSRL